MIEVENDCIYVTDYLLHNNNTISNWSYKEIKTTCRIHVI